MELDFIDKQFFSEIHVFGVFAKRIKIGSLKPQNSDLSLELIKFEKIKTGTYNEYV